ncbi:MAG: lamin tail domain-containing protein, partial [Sedimentisphaerales bacterium]|nr:lamin tail domain-containing protein [Sedimentisphaerales bacterium]
MRVGCRSVLPIIVLALLWNPCTRGECPPGDLNGDCRVDATDLHVLAQQWMAPPDSTADLNGDDNVDSIDFAYMAIDWRTSGVALRINEVLATNVASGKDLQGQYDDWIEIYNAGQQAIDCAGMYLTDDPANPTKWQIPAGNPSLTTIPADGYLLIWADTDTTSPGLHASFSLSADGDEVALYDKDGVTLIDYIAFDEQQTDISYGRSMDRPDEWEQFGLPTPGAKNVQAYQGIVEEPVFSPERGFYDSEILVTLSTRTAGATIYYTTDGTEPYLRTGRFPTGKVYQAPLRILSTTCLRAKAIKDGWKPSTIATHTYLCAQDVVSRSRDGAAPGSGWPTGSVRGQVIDYGMDPDVTQDERYKDLIDDALLAIPSISLVTSLSNFFHEDTGFYVHPNAEGRAWERPVSVELLNPDGSEGFQIDAGIRVRGGYSRSTSNPKHGLRLFFRPEYGRARLHFPLFGNEGVDEFENVDLRCSQNYSWSFGGDAQETLIREVFSRDTQGETGQPYTRSRFYHVYINGYYWGVYQTQERSEASYAESYFGGDKDDYDVVKTDRSVGRAMLATDGNMDAYRRLYDAFMQNLADNSRYYQLQGLNADATPNPAYERLLDVDNLIDFMIIEYYTGDRDGPGSRFGNIPNNTYGIYNRAHPDGWKWCHHDNEHTLGTSQSETNMVTPFTSAGSQWRYFNPHWQHERLANTNAEYRMRFADHVYRHFFKGGLLTPDVSIARFQRRAKEVEMAVIAESARWGDSKRSRPLTKQDWQNEINRVVTSYMPGRTNVVLSQFKSVGWYPNVNPPTFNLQGGHVQPGFSLQISGSGGTVYYCLDGSDPRLPGGAVNASSTKFYTGPIGLTASTHVKARILSGTTWSALNEAVFAVRPVAANLRISEILYHPAEAGNPDDPNSEYIELTNIGAESINLNLVRFTNGIDFTFPSLDLAPGGYCLVVRDRAAFAAKYGSALPVAGQYAGSLNNAGERIELRDAAGAVIHDFRFEDDWFDITDGLGFSLTVKDPKTADPNTYSDKNLWRPSAKAGGSPGADDSGQVPALGSVVINELLANSQGSGPDWIELHNTTGQPIDIAGWFLSDDANNLTQYEITAGTSLPADGYVVFYENRHFGSQADPGCQEPFALSASGETLSLHSGSAGVLTGYSQREKFDASEAGVSLGRYQESTGTYNFVAMSVPTPGAVNAAPQVGPVVIDEIMYHP